MHSKFHCFAALSDAGFGNGAPEYALGCTDLRFRSEQSDQFGLLSLDKQIRHNAVKHRIKFRPLDGPSISWPPTSWRASPDWPKNHASSDLLASLKERAIATNRAYGGTVKTNAARLTRFVDLKASLSFKESGKPRPFFTHWRNMACKGCAFNPQYAAMAERRCREDAPLFAEVAAE